MAARALSIFGEGLEVVRFDTGKRTNVVPELEVQRSILKFSKRAPKLMTLPPRIASQNAMLVFLFSSLPFL